VVAGGFNTLIVALPDVVPEQDASLKLTIEYVAVDVGETATT
jgi:hypothetical protein